MSSIKSRDTPAYPPSLPDSLRIGHTGQESPSPTQPTPAHAPSRMSGMPQGMPAARAIHGDTRAAQAQKMAPRRSSNPSALTRTREDRRREIEAGGYVAPRTPSYAGMGSSHPGQITQESRMALRPVATAPMERANTAPQPTVGLTREEARERRRREIEAGGQSAPRAPQYGGTGRTKADDVQSRSAGLEAFSDHSRDEIRDMIRTGISAEQIKQSGLGLPTHLIDEVAQESQDLHRPVASPAMERARTAPLATAGLTPEEARERRRREIEAGGRSVPRAPEYQGTGRTNVDDVRTRSTGLEAFSSRAREEVLDMLRTGISADQIKQSNQGIPDHVVDQIAREFAAHSAPQFRNWWES